MSEEPIRGSCLCGEVRFELTGRPLFMTCCHCSRCRKVGGSTIVAVRSRDFRWVTGQDRVVRYRPAPPHRLVRCFCGTCGTYIGEPDPEAEGFPIAANALDDDPGVRLALHEHAAHKPAWYEILDDRPRFPGPPPQPGGPGGEG